jgi:hypothetical protein
MRRVNTEDILHNHINPDRKNYLILGDTGFNTYTVFGKDHNRYCKLHYNYGTSHLSRFNNREEYLYELKELLFNKDLTIYELNGIKELRKFTMMKSLIN